MEKERTGSPHLGRLALRPLPLLPARLVCWRVSGTSRHNFAVLLPFRLRPLRWGMVGGGPGACSTTLGIRRGRGFQLAIGLLFAKLRAPSRMAMHERAARPDTVLEDTNLAEVEAGAIEDGMPVGTGDGTASLQQLILAQTQVLAKLAQPKAVDPLSAALANMTKEENFLGAKGSAARDAYIKVLSDNRATAAAVRKMGAEAMGLPTDNVPANLMLDYVERKMPVGDQKMLAMIASFAASGWRAARDEGNISLEGWMAKLLVFCDQSSVEGGRTQLPWLLTGLSDPNFAAMNRRRQGIRPFGRLIPSAWMSANLAYIKEMDFLGARISGASSSYDTGLHDPPAAPPPVEDDHPQPKKPPRRPPRKPRGTGSES